MMQSIENIIFAELAGRREVVLPGIGTLRVERVAATRNGRAVTAPRNVVNFSSKEREGAVSLVGLLAAAGVPDAESVYARWVEAQPAAGTVVVEGVGTLRAKNFRPSPELEAVLNPGRTDAPVRLRRRCRRLGLWIPLGIIVLLACLVAGMYAVYGPDGMASIQSRIAEFVCGGEGEAKRPEQAPEVVAPEAPEDAPLPADSIPGGVGEEPAVKEEAAAPAGARYVVVGGVFSVDENAEKYIARMKRKYPDLESEYPKMPYKGGKIMVGLYVSADMDDAKGRMKELSRRTAIYDLWIYKAESR